MNDDASKNFVPQDMFLAISTLPDEAKAIEVAEKLVREDLVKCVNVVPKLTSIYSWEGKVETQSECLLIIKGVKTKLEKFKTQYFKIHPYDVPEFLVIEPTEANPDYLNWILS